ncbi:MAG: hypothetical protein LBT53_08295, partial [Puniceicoccales bacterium]|nr:hypothetical protein [Puniceicoccales bacterium]
MKRFHSRLLSFLLAVAIASVAPASYAATLSTTAAAALPAAATGVAITVASDAPSAVHSAVADLAAALTKVFPSDNFAISPAAATAATARRIEIVIAGRGLSGAPAPAPESFRIEKINNCTGVRVSGADTLGAVYGIYALLESYGCGFYLTYDTLPAPKKEKWTPPENNISDAPLAKERYSFNWHNFLSGCSGWDLAEWKRWIDQCRKMRFNVLMVHAYGNNPMFTFSFRGVQKKSGFLASTAAGRDWGTPHVNDVRRLVGGEFFTAANTGPIFGTPPSLLPREQQPAATQLFMKQVFAYAKAQGMKIAFQLDIDTASAIPSAMLEKLPASAKIKMGKTLRPNPETPDGKDYYKTIFTTLLATYPEINTLVICVRTDPVPEAGNFDASAFPETWKQACSAAVKNNPALQNKRRVAAYFWIGKVIKTFQEIARETGHADTPIHLATWNLKPWIDYANAFSPKETAFLPLDYRELFNQSELASAKDLAWLRKIAQSGRRVIPIIWSHHDDGNYIGRPHTPFENFASLLEEAGCESFGIIHWLLRPQSLHFKSHSTQVWKTTKNQPLKETSRIMARHLFGEENETKGGAYFYDWITNGPIFGRETTEFMIGYVNHIFSRKRYAQIQEGTKNRLQLLQQIKVSPDKPNAQKHLEYWRGLEKFNEHFYRAELALQEGVFALKKSRLREVAEIAEDINPDAVIEDFTRYASKLDMTRGDLGLLV